MRITSQLYGVLNGQEIMEYTLKNENGLEVACINYGCVITRICLPNHEGKIENIVLGFETLEEYVLHSPYFGAVVGRVAGRIRDASFELEGKKIHVTQNNGENHIHGGAIGLSRVIWKNTESDYNEDAAVLTFSYISLDGEEGYPGNLELSVTYTLTNNDELLISYGGICDKTTLLNLTNHSYFNLSGNQTSDISEHELELESDYFLKLNEQSIPTGELIDVTDTPFDFREGKKLKEGIESNHPQIVLVGQGYDHPFLLKVNNQREIILTDRTSRRQMIIETDQPGVIIYTANQLQTDFEIRGGRSRKYLGICLETQGIPDAIHHNHFPSIVLEKGNRYESTTKYSFKVI